MEEKRTLIEAAKKAKEGAYCPYSGFAVGAALLSADGRIFTGSNVENAAYGECICAERTAFVKAVSAGVRSFCMIAVISDSKTPTAPCGSCRQVMAEFCSPEFRILMCDAAGVCEEITLKELLPYAFSLEEHR